MTNGTIKFFNAAKGFGFITPEGGGKDVFVPVTSVTASGVSGLKAGQLVSFETEPDAKGPKAVNLKLLAEAQPQTQRVVKERPAPPPSDAGRPKLTLFHDPASEESRIALAALRAAGQDPRIIDYRTTPPTRDELKNLSILLRGGDQSLVRKYEPLFQELRLDDRFISENEFWDGIVEHPSLINGPVLATAQKARICRTENAVRSFLGLPEEIRTATKPKEIPERPAALGVPAPVPVMKMEDAEKAEPQPAQKIRPKASALAAKKPKTEVKTKIKAKTKTETETKKAAKAPKPAKKAAPKPVKKARRASKK